MLNSAENSFKKIAPEFSQAEKDMGMAIKKYNEQTALIAVEGTKHMAIIALHIAKLSALMKDHNRGIFKGIQIFAQITNLLKSIGYDVSKVPIVPISAYKGDNVSKKSENTDWYHGKTLIEYFDDFVVPTKPVDKPLRLPIQDVYTITGHGTVPVGKVEAGHMKPGDKIIVMPSKAVGEVKKIEEHHKELAEAGPGDNIGFNIKGIDKKDIKRGYVVGPVDNPPTVAKEFRAQIIVLQHPTAISVGYTPVFHLHTAQIPCRIVEIVEKKDPKTGQTVEKNPDFIKTGDAAVVKIKPLKPVVVEKYTDFPALGRFAIRDMGTTVAAGIVLDVEKA